MSKEKNNSLLYVKFFLAAVLILIVFGSITKLFNLYQERNFTQNTYNLLIISDKYVGVVGIDDNNNHLSAALIRNDLDRIKKENIMLQSLNFEIPIHGYVSYPDGKNPPAPTQEFFSFGNIQSILMDTNIKKKGMSFFDWVRLHFAAKEIESDSQLIKAFAGINDFRGLLAEQDENYFRDSVISNRKTSMQIINATSINGVAGRVGEMYSRTGFNVVSVMSEEGIDDSQVAYSEESFMEDARFIQKSFDFTIQNNPDYEVADVTLIIGEESELMLENIVN